MKYLKIIILFITVTFIISCNEQDPIIEINGSEESAPIKYSVEFIATWSEETHPNEFPASAHFSGLIGSTHKEGVSLFQVGKLASAGIKSMAETGSKSQLKTEIESLIASEDAGFMVDGSGISSSPGNTTAEFEINESHSLVTITTMIAPSPDWFVAVSALNLHEDNEWVQEIEIEVGTYDAGTDGGSSFTSPNQASKPLQPISEIADGPLSSFGVVPSLGTMKFTRIE
jgi:hypothetical protein